MRKNPSNCLKVLLLTTVAMLGLSSCSLKREGLASETSESQEQALEQPSEQIASVSKHKSPQLIAEEATGEIAAPPPETSLWDYMAARQELTAIKHPRISAFETYFLKHKRLLNKKTDKAAPYLYYIIQELEKRKMPLELAFTPMVESNFDPLAHSVVQAAGLWQFMPKTAKGFGLEINQWYDGRRDIVASTDAALTYYQYLNKMFDGDWLLTVAAYNLGEGNVLKAIKKNRKAGKATDYWSLKLPKETMRHVPKWLALANVLINQPQFNLALTEIKNTPVFASLDIAAPANLAQLATLTGLDKTEFYGLNPAYNKLFIPAEIKNASILVPIESLEEFEFKLQNTPAELFKVSFSYQVKAGDNLSKIAHNNQTNVTAIKQLNGLKSDRLQIGQVLKLPGMVEVKKEEQTFFSTLNKNQKRRKYKVYRVRSGDSLWKIARKFKVTTSKIAKWNGLNKKKVLKIGQPLKIWPSS